MHKPASAKWTTVGWRTRKIFGSLVDITNIGVSCTTNPPSVLTGTYAAAPGSNGAGGYFNFNADGTFTNALIHNNVGCNVQGNTRNGNGVEYGVFTWNPATGEVDLPVAPVVDTNGGCGFDDPVTPPPGRAGYFKRVGDTINVYDDDPATVPGAPIIGTGIAVESTPGSLIGAWTQSVSNGSLLVFRADATFLLVEDQLQLGTLFPANYGQERGCYTVSATSVAFRADATCLPDGVAAYDLNSFGGVLPIFAGAPITYTLDDPDTLTIFGVQWKRTHPN